MSLLERLDVPEAKSRASTSPTVRPRVAASSAAPDADDTAADDQDVELAAGFRRRRAVHPARVPGSAGERATDLMDVSFPGGPGVPVPIGSYPARCHIRTPDVRCDA